MIKIKVNEIYLQELKQLKEYDPVEAFTSIDNLNL
jgi:hypothetical protein